MRRRDLFRHRACVGHRETRRSRPATPSVCPRGKLVRPGHVIDLRPRDRTRVVCCEAPRSRDGDGAATLGHLGFDERNRPTRPDDAHRHLEVAHRDHTENVHTQPSHRLRVVVRGTLDFVGDQADHRRDVLLGYRPCSARVVGRSEQPIAEPDEICLRVHAEQHGRSEQWKRWQRDDGSRRRGRRCCCRCAGRRCRCGRGRGRWGRGGRWSRRVRCRLGDGGRGRRSDAGRRRDAVAALGGRAAGRGRSRRRRRGRRRSQGRARQFGSTGCFGARRRARRGRRGRTRPMGLGGGSTEISVHLR